MAQFSLSWDAHKQNICSGLCSLQQNGEFVDMTIAADGHHVKVHQMVMSLVSPYIKDLITSAQCPHPVIFLNKISYATLCSVLEYIYTGEVVVEKDNIEEVVQAGKELHIRGLEDMKIEVANKNQSQNVPQAAYAIANVGQPLTERRNFKTNESQPNIDQNKDKVFNFSVNKRKRISSPRRKSFQIDSDDHFNDNTFDDAMETDTDTDTKAVDVKKKNDKTTEKIDNEVGAVVCSVPIWTVDVEEGHRLHICEETKTPVQYTISNGGSVQLIVNRYIYRLSYSSRKEDDTRLRRRWECSHCVKGKFCKATVFTEGNVIVKRCSAHSHPYHDHRILKKVHANLVFSTLNDVEAALEIKKRKLGNNTSQSKNNNTDNKEDTTDAE